MSHNATSRAILDVLTPSTLLPTLPTKQTRKPCRRYTHAFTPSSAVTSNYLRARQRLTRYTLRCIPSAKQHQTLKMNILKMVTEMWSFLRRVPKAYCIQLTRVRATYPFPAICGLIATVPVMVLSLWVSARVWMIRTRK